MRVVTYNIRGGLGMDRRRSTRRIAQVLREIDADIVCLQEVHRRLPWSGFRNQPRILRRLLGMDAVFQNNYPVGLGGYGNLIASRFPIMSRQSRRLPNVRERRSILKSPERRGALSATVDAPGGPLTVVTTHWSLDARDRQESAQLMAARNQAIPAPVVLCGDLNAGPESQEIALLLRSTGLRDSGAHTGAATFPSDAPRARIDFVFLSQTIHQTAVYVVPSGASDHLPLVVEW